MDNTKVEITVTDKTGYSNPVNQETNVNGVMEKDHAVTIHLEGGLDGLTAEHKEYLISRHGTTDLSPLPTMDPGDPLNWPSWKVYIFIPVHFYSRDLD